MIHSTEQTLIAKAKKGDRSAIATLIRAHQNSLYAFMLRMSGRPDVAEDIVQEAFVRVLKNLDRFDSRYRFSTWLFTIAKRLYANHMEKFRPASETDLVQSWRGSGDAPDDEAQFNEIRDRTRARLALGLAALNPVQREIVLLFHQQSWAITEIAQQLGIPEGTIKSHLHRARRKMREAIEADDAAREETLWLNRTGSDRPDGWTEVAS